MITKEHLKEEIEQLDEDYLELVFRLLQQFPHHEKIKQKPDALQCSRLIDYATSEADDMPVFTEVVDAAAYGKQLRTSLWQRNKHV
jgi:hypothetical protein